MGRGQPVGPGGLVIVDKSGGMTSHDVVARVRRLARTRRVGHAGTLDPMATGVLVLGVDRATRLLGHLALTEKSYDATIRLGASTVTDDAEGDMVSVADASSIDDESVRAALPAFVGDIEQVPSSVSAIKVDGQRSYARVRAGEEVALAARPVRIGRFDLLSTHRDGGFFDLEVTVDCSSGTYIRALARDLGAALGVGGHLTALRRTRVGSFGLDAAATLAELEQPDATVVRVPLNEAAAISFPRVDIDADLAAKVRNGGALPAAVVADVPAGNSPDAPIAVFDPAGQFIALVANRNDRIQPIAVFSA